MKKRSLFFIFVATLGVLCFAYKKIKNYIFLDGSSGEEIFECIKTDGKSFGHIFLYIGISLIMISIIGLVVTFRSFASKSKRVRKIKRFEDLYS